MISLIVPCYNEEEVIATTLERLTGIMSGVNEPFEIICINDGSRDKTLSIIQSFCGRDKKIKCLSFSRNFGHQPAISAGIHHAGGDAAIIIDADLQDPPELIPRMIDLWRKEECNVVYAVREKRHKESFFKKATASLYYRVIRSLSEINIPGNTGDFRLIDRKVINAFKGLTEKQKYVRGLISWVGFKQIPIYYNRQGRHSGETKYKFWKMVHLARTGLLYFTDKPLTVAVFLGLFSFLVGIILTGYVIISKFYFPETTMRGWSSLLIAVIFFGGVQLLSIGLLGSYIGSIFNEVKNRPEFILESRINFEE